MVHREDHSLRLLNLPIYMKSLSFPLLPSTKVHRLKSPFPASDFCFQTWLQPDPAPTTQPTCTGASHIPTTRSTTRSEAMLPLPLTTIIRSTLATEEATSAVSCPSL